MNKTSSRFTDGITGIDVELNFVSRNMNIFNFRDKREFVFQHSKEETVRKIGEALIRIADLAKKELGAEKKIKLPRGFGGMNF